MSKFIKSSLWNFSANFFMRLLTVLVFPFLVRFITREDIALFKSFQAFTLILINIIPFGSNIFYLSSSKSSREEKWDLVFYVSLIFSIVISITLLLSERTVGFFIKNDTNLFLRYLVVLFPLFECFKILSITKLSSDMNFKEISKALIIKQIFLYSGIVLAGLYLPSLNILIFIVVLSELLELMLLLNQLKKFRYSILPKLVINLKLFSKKAIKYLIFSGLDQLLLTFAVQFPTIYVVMVLGKNIAPEFQLPFYAVNLPVSLVMQSIARSAFPHFSNLRENKLIADSLNNILYILSLSLFPILFAIHFFAKEINGFFFDSTWSNAVFALQFFPLLMIFYTLCMPSTFIPNIKDMPYINLIYSVLLFFLRLLSIRVGYSIAGFRGTVLLFVGVDIFIRVIRFIVDLSLISHSLTKVVLIIKSNLISMFFFIFLSWGLKICGLPKLTVFFIGLTTFIFYNYFFERTKITFYLKKIKNSILYT